MHFLALPDEIIHHIIYYLDPLEILWSFQRVNRRAALLAQAPLIWKANCKHSFKFWSPSHDYSTLKTLPVAGISWKDLFVLRAKKNARASLLFREIMTTKLRRWEKFEEIYEMGYDAKDFLVQHCAVDESSELGLATRYWARAILDNFHRSIAIYEWQSMLTENAPTNQLEKVLGCFDLFVLGSSEGDLDDISRLLDDTAANFRASTPDFESFSTKEKALALNRWLRAQNLTGVQNAARDYRNLRNCLIGQALRHPDHESIPIISSAIFACVARRLGLLAGCCGFPTHVHAVVALPGEEVPRMYLDPFGNDDEVLEQDLRSILRRFRWPIGAEALEIMPDASIVTRIAGNINETNNMVYGRRAIRDGDPTNHDYTQLIEGHGWPVMSACQYAGLWSKLLLSQPAQLEWLTDLEELFDHMIRTFPEDCWLVERYLMPIYDTLGPIPNGNLYLESRQALGTIRRSDQELGPVCPRVQDEQNAALYRVGDVFKHRRYEYFGIITGWSSQDSRARVESTMTDGELQAHYSPLGLMNRLQMDDKTYYTYIRNMTSERYIATEDNIELVRDPEVIRDHVFVYAGKYFKRFDRETCRFVSNIQEQFPDD